MEINSYILNLIIRQLQGKISATEQNELEQWIASSKDHQLEYHKIVEIWDASKNLNLDIDVDKEWNTFKSRHFNSPKKGKLIKHDFRMVSRIAAAAILIIGVFLLGRYFLGSETYTTLSGERLLVNLEDGSRVILGENSQLEIPSGFNKSKRTLNLSGEGFFKVAKNPNKPFEIKGEQTTTRVLGTEFYLVSSEANNQVRVSGGKVAYWQNYGSDTLILTQGKEGLLIKNKLTEGGITSANYDSWQTGTFIFENQPLLEVLHSLQDHYIFNVANLEKLQNADCLFSGKFTHQSLEDVLGELALVMGLEYEWKQSILTVKKLNCK